MAKVRSVQLGDRPFWYIRCEACGYHHIPADEGWTLQGDFDNPTFTPSIDETVNRTDSKEHRPGIPTRRCHFIITAGKIKYCPDCTHALAGQTHDLADLAPR